MTGLLANWNFSQSLTGWTTVNNHWYAAPKQTGDGKWWAQCDQDWDRKKNQPRGWLYGDEDWLSQVVAAPEPHTEVSLTVTEIQHVKNGTVVIPRLYGSYDGIEWTLLWERLTLEPDVPPVTPENRQFYTNTYIFPSDHPFLKFEVYGLYLDQAVGKAAYDGYKITEVILETNTPV